MSCYALKEQWKQLYARCDCFYVNGDKMTWLENVILFLSN